MILFLPLFKTKACQYEKKHCHSKYQAFKFRESRLFYHQDRGNCMHNYEFLKIRNPLNIQVFMGSGVGDPFGPRCNKGDIMGCGVLFPRDFEFRSDSEEEDEVQELVYSLGEETDSGDEEEYCQPHHKQGEKIQVFFTRNGKLIGKKDVFLPKGGFYPTVGMMSTQEKVWVELRPLSG